MAPSSNQPAFAKDERVLCFHHELLYEAKVLDSRFQDASDKKSPMQFRVHYKGWKNTWDDWVPQDRIRKYTEENIELSRNLKREMDALRNQGDRSKKLSGATKKKGGAGSEFSSQRDSEERHSSVQAAGPRGQKRARDYEIEKVQSSCSRLSSRFSESLLIGNHERVAATMARMKYVPPRADEFDPSLPSQGSNPSSPSQGSDPSLRPQGSDDASSSSLSPARSITPPFLDVSSIALGAENESGSSEHSPDSSEPRGSRKSSNTRSNRPTSLKAKPRTRAKAVPKNSAKKTQVAKQSSTAKINSKKEDQKNARLVRETVNRLIRDKDRHSHGMAVAKEIFLQTEQPNQLFMIAGFTAEKPREPEAKKGAKRKISDILEQEEAFINRPAVRLHVPDHLKAILVDDWENVTKNLQLAPLPSRTPVNQIMADYYQDERKNRRPGSAEADILEEVVQGIKEYFELSLGKILLYRFERQQYAELRKLWIAGEGDFAGKSVGDVYGAEHLARLFVNMPELIAQTNMDAPSVNRLREELARVTQWLAKNSKKYFSDEYETATQDYIERARGN